MFSMKHWSEILHKCVKGAFLNIKVNFLVAGTQKGGTSALTRYLRAHPQVCMARQKEVHFFDREYFWPVKKLNYFYYHSYFAPEDGHLSIGESTPIYMYWMDSPRRIWEYNPGMKLIIILRNPIERAYSQWNMEREKNKDNLNFWQAIQQESERGKGALPYQHRVFSYIDRGFYTEQLRRIWQFFPKDQTLILKNEQLRNDPESTLQAITAFLGIAMVEDVEVKEVHSRRYITEMSSREKQCLTDIYKNEIQELEYMLQWDCRKWLE